MLMTGQEIAGAGVPHEMNGWRAVQKSTQLVSKPAGNRVVYLKPPAAVVHAISCEHLASRLVPGFEQLTQQGWLSAV